MAGVKISALPLTLSAQLTDLFPVVQGGVTSGETLSQVETLFGYIAGILQVTSGGTGVNAVTTAPAATKFAGWDANKNLSANSFLSGYTTTATAAGTTTLLVGSTFQQYFTGVTTQTVLLPVTSTLVLGQSFLIVNNSSGVVTVQSSGANTIQAMAANTQLIVTCILTSGTTAASWNALYTPANLSVPVSSSNGGTGVSSPTAHTLPVAEGASAMTFIGPLTNGQLVIGSTGADPVPAVITGSGGISVTVGAGTIALSGTTGGVSWTVVGGTSQAMAVNNGYISNNAGTVTMTTPATFGVGDVMYVRGLGAGGWLVQANTGQTIHVGSSASSVAGSIASTNQWDAVKLYGLVANTTWSTDAPQSSGLTIA